MKPWKIVCMTYLASLPLVSHSTVGQKIDSAASAASGAVNKVEKAVVKGAKAAASGVERGAKAAGKAADTAAKKLGVPGAGASAAK